MPRFSDALLKGMLTSTLPEQIHSTAYSMGQAPRVRQARKEQERKDKGILGGTLAAQQMAREGMFTPEVARDFAGSLQGFGVNPNQILEQTGQLSEISQKQAARNSVASAFDQWTTENNIDPEIKADVKRGINAGTVTTAQEAIDLAVTNSQKAFEKEYFSNISVYDPAIGTLVQRGNYEAAEQRFQALQSRIEQGPANEYLADFQDKGSEITAANRGKVWGSVVATTKDLNEATTVMARLEKNSVDLRAAKHTGPTRQITYIPKAATQTDPTTGQPIGMLPSFSFGDPSKVTTKQINAPVDPKTGEIEAQWMKDFMKYSAQRVIGRGEITEPDLNTDPKLKLPTGGENPTLGQLLSPELQNKLVNTQMQE